MNAERSSSGFWLVPVLVGLGAAAAGIGAGWFLRGGQAAAAPVTVQAAGGVTREELEAAKREILEQFALLDRAPPERSPATPAPPNEGVSDAVVALGRRFDDLDARIALLTSALRPGNGSRAWTDSRGPGSESLEKLYAQIQDAYGRGQGVAGISTRLREQHQLWMVEDLVRAYGPPEHVSSSGSDILFYYGPFQVQGRDEPGTVIFKVNQGYVIDPEFRCSF